MKFPYVDQASNYLMCYDSKCSTNFIESIYKIIHGYKSDFMDGDVIDSVNYIRAIIDWKHLLLCASYIGEAKGNL